MKKNVFRRRGTLNLFLRHTFTRTADDWGPLEDKSVIFYDDIPEHHPSGEFRDMGDIVEFTQAKRELEEHKLRELAASMPKPTEPAPAPEHEELPVYVRCYSEWKIGSHSVVVGTNTNGTKYTLLDGHLISVWELDEIIKSLTKARAEVA